LEGREKQVIYLLFGMEEETEAMDLRSVGKILSISHEMVRKIRDKALDRLKKRLAPQF
jgi:DNA-directed RNA polymerase sigma subunit (sigma70/sigma32)